MLLTVPALSQAQTGAASAQYFKNLDVSLTLGTTGVGLELGTNLGDYMRLRGGFDAMIRFEPNVRFGVASMDVDGNLSANFTKLSEKLKTFTGYDVDDYIDMTCKPTFYNFKLLFDVFPFKRADNLWRNFYFTAGFYWGSSEIGRAINTVEGAQTLTGIRMYNHLYGLALSGEPMVTLSVKDEIDGQYYDTPIYLDYNLSEKLKETGRLGVNVGVYKEDIKDADGNVIHKKGTPYMMEPDKDGTVRATVKANPFKPYVGIGYGGRLLKNNDRYHVSADLGMLFWGGKPSILTHDGTDLNKDVVDIGGKVGDYVDFVGGLRVYPVLNVRFTTTLF